uniref:guanylate cyclase n=1 Tax=Romanomermis culicivorax TaxID=13658 RepID=A0A915L9N2_ROMCU
MGRALKELLLHFNWKRVASFYTDDNASRRCYSIVDSLKKTLLKAGIVNVLNTMVERISPTDDEIMSFLQTIKQFARIILVCLEHERDMRRFMLKAHELEMTNDEYVFIMPDFVRDNNRSEMWLDMDSNANIDNMDQAAKKAFRATMMVEMLTSSNDELHYFKKEIIRKAKEEPFLIDSSNVEDQYGSLYSPFLHDSIYLYALALNKTLQQGGTIEDTRWITNNTKNTRFLGLSGEVVIDSQNTREPNFVVRIFDKGMKMTRVVELLMSNSDGKTVNVLVPDKILFENRNGIAPKDVPDCGFLNEKCVVVRQSITHWVAIGAFMCFLMVGLSTVGVFFFVKRRMLCNELGKMLWKINYRDIVFLNDKSRRSKSLGSLRTISTVASDETNEAMAKGDKNVAHHKGILVTVKNHEVSAVLSNESDQKHLKCMKDMVHDNLNVFVGLCIDSPQPISLWKYASKGSLEDILHADTVKLDWFFKYSLLRDVVSGMEYLHSSEILTHGQLKSSNCVVDGRWVCKISDYGLNKLRVESKDAKDKLWTAPELLISTNTHSLPVSQPGDVYAFAILTQEVLLRDRPFCAENLIPEIIIKRVAKTESPPFRPTVKLDKENDVDPAMIQIMNDCWKEDPVLRPNFKHVKSLMKQMARGKNFNLMDHILKMMEKYASGLEQKISDRTRVLTEEAKKADLLLYRMLPKAVADRLKSGQMCDPETFNNVSILLSDVVGFSVISARSTPLQTVNLLNELYSVFDDVISEYDAYK